MLPKLRLLPTALQRYCPLFCPTNRQLSGAAMAFMHNRNQNHLLAALPKAELERLSPHLEPVAMPLGEVLYEPGGRLQHVYFPVTSIISMHYVMENGASSEIAGVGNEGMLGISLFMGGNTTPSSAFVR